MASFQRRRGEPFLIFPIVTKVDHRGNEVQVPQEVGIECRGRAVPERSSRAEVAGQKDIEVLRLITAGYMPDVNIWSRVYYRGSWWDQVAPPEPHIGTRHVRHWSLLISRRQDGGDLG